MAVLCSGATLAGTVPFPIPGDLGATSGFAINDSGTVVGNYALSGNTHGYIGDGTGSFTTYDYPGARLTFLTGINNAGQITGIAVTSFFAPAVPFVTSGGTAQALPVLGTPSDINDSGQIVGSLNDNQAFLFSGGVTTAFSYPGALVTRAFGINNLGQIVGIYQLPDSQFQGYLYSGGTFQTISFPGSTLTDANAINDAGTIVGRMDDASGSHGFILSGGSYQQVDLPGDYNFTSISGINNFDEMAGSALASAGLGHTGFTATETPEPGPAIPLALLGAMACWMLRRK